MSRKVAVAAALQFHNVVGCETKYSSVMRAGNYFNKILIFNLFFLSILPTHACRTTSSKNARGDPGNLELSYPDKNTELRVES